MMTSAPSRPAPRRQPLSLFATMALLLAWPAAAQDARPKPPRPPAGEAPGPAVAHLFISPAGEPFRADPDAAYPVARWFARADSDGDGRLTRAEFLADADRYFATLDTDSSGQIEAAEVDAYEAGVLAPLRRQRVSFGADGNLPDKRDRTPPSRAVASGAGPYGLINIPHPVKAADRDMNSRISKEEWSRTLADRFTLLDPTQTGFLTLETLPKTPAQLYHDARKAAVAKSAGGRTGKPPEPRAAPKP